MSEIVPDGYHMEPQHLNNMVQGHGQLPEPEGHGVVHNAEQPQPFYRDDNPGYEGVVGDYDVAQATPFGGYEVPLAQPRQALHSAHFAAQEHALFYTGYGLPGNAAPSAETPIEEMAYATNQIPTSDTTIRDNQHPMVHAPYYPIPDHPLPPQLVYELQPSTALALDPRRHQSLVPAAQEPAPVLAFPGAGHLPYNYAPPPQSPRSTQSEGYMFPQDAGNYGRQYHPQAAAPSAGVSSFGHADAAYAQNDFVTPDAPIEHALYAPELPQASSPRLNHGPQTWAGSNPHPHPSPLSTPATSQTHTPTSTPSALFSPAGAISSTSTTPTQHVEEPYTEADLAAMTPEPWDLEATPVKFKGEVPGHPGWKAIPRLVPQVCLLAGHCGLSGADLPTGKGGWANHIYQKHGGAAQPVLPCSWPGCTTEGSMSLISLGRHVSEHHLGEDDMLCLQCHFRDWCAAYIKNGADGHGALSVPVKHSITRNDKHARMRHAGPCMRNPLLT